MSYLTHTASVTAAASAPTERGSERCGSDPDRLGEKIARTLKKRRLPRRLRIAKGDQRLAVVLHDALPGRLFGKILASYYGKSVHEKEGKK